MKVERKKLILIVASVVAAVLLGAAITISFLTAPKAEDPSLPGVPTPNQTREPELDDSPIEQGSQVIIDDEDKEEGDVPPEGLYDNIYTDDLGYDKLPDSFDPEVNPIEGTVYDDEYVFTTMSRLMCELSTKNTVTERALKPLTDFSDDLRRSTASTAYSTLQQIEYDLRWFNNNVGERIPGEEKSLLNMNYCGAGDIGEVGENPE